MKPQTLFRRAAAPLALGLAVLSGCKQAPEKASPSVDPPVTKIVAAPAATNEPAAVAAPPSTSATVKTAPRVAPLSPGVVEVVRLAQAGVSEQVMMAYVDNSPLSFDLKVDEVVYLNDLGVPGTVISALLQHRESFADRAAGEDKIPDPAPVPTTPQPPATTATPAQTVATTPPLQAPPPVAVAPPGPTNNTPPQQPAVIVSQPPAEVQYIAPPEQVTDNYFYDSLAPYGSWIYVADYGWCWQPSVASLNVDWQPYSDNGRWLDTDNGWYWQSGYTWGWAPFHYGRWHRSPGRGWVWLPDTTWGPAWVTWRQTPEYCGWAPLPPGCLYEPGFGLRYRGARIGLDFDFGFGAECYTFVHLGHFYDRSPWQHRVPLAQARGFMHGSQINHGFVASRGNVVINRGVPVENVRRFSREEVRRVSFHDVDARQAGKDKPEHFERNGQTLNVFRPQLPKQAWAPPQTIIHRQEESRRAAASLTAAVANTPGAFPAPGSPPQARQPLGSSGAPAAGNQSQLPFRKIEPRPGFAAPSTTRPSDIVSRPVGNSSGQGHSQTTQSAAVGGGQAAVAQPALATTVPGSGFTGRPNGNPAGNFNPRPSDPGRPEPHAPAPGASIGQMNPVTTPALPGGRVPNAPPVAGDLANKRTEERAYFPPNSTPAPNRPQTPVVIQNKPVENQATAPQANPRNAPNQGQQRPSTPAYFNQPSGDQTVVLREPGNPRVNPSGRITQTEQPGNRPAPSPTYSQPVARPQQNYTPQQQPNNVPASRPPTYTAPPIPQPASRPQQNYVPQQAPPRAATPVPSPPAPASRPAQTSQPARQENNSRK